MLPDGVTTIHAHSSACATPQFGGLAGARCCEFDTDDVGKGLLSRPAGGAAACPRLGELRGGGDAFAEGFVDDDVNPAFNKRDQGFQAGRGGSVAGAYARGEVLVLQALHGLLDLCGVATIQVQVADGLFDVGGVNLQAGGVFLHGGHEALDQPRHVAEQALACGLACGDVDHHFLARQVQALGNLRDVARQDRTDAGGCDRQAEVGAGQRLLGKIAQCVAQLHAELHGVHLVNHADHRAHHLAGLFRHGV